jgi:hypothetical protein
VQARESTFYVLLLTMTMEDVGSQDRLGSLGAREHRKSGKSNGGLHGGRESTLATEEAAQVRRTGGITGWLI